MSDLITDPDRTGSVNIGGKDYPLILTTKATKEIAKKYGGIQELGKELFDKGGMDEGLELVVWLITLLANQAILIHNYQYPEDKKELLTEEMIEILTTPYELAQCKNAVLAAATKGMKRNVLSEDDDSKNKEGA